MSDLLDQILGGRPRPRNDLLDEIISSRGPAAIPADPALTPSLGDVFAAAMEIPSAPTPAPPEQPVAPGGFEAPAVAAPSLADAFLGAMTPDLTPALSGRNAGRADRATLGPVQGPPVPDESSWITDLEAGLLQAEQIIPGFRQNMAIRDMQTAGDVVSDAQARAANFRAQADALEAELPNLPEEDRPALMDEVALLRDRAGQMDLTAETSLGERALSEIVTQAMEIDRLNREIGAIPMNPAAQDVAAAPTMQDALTAAAQDPIGAIRTFGLRSLPASAPTIGGAILGQLAAGPIGAAGLSGLGSFSTEQQMSIAQGIDQALRDAGVDLADEAAVRAFIEANPGALEDVARTALIRGGVISAADAATAGVVGSIARAVKGASRATRAGTALATGSIVEPAGEMAGEAGAQVASGQDIQPGEIVAEGLGGMAVGGPAAVVQAAAEGRTPTEAQPPQPRPETPAQPPVTEAPAPVSEPPPAAPTPPAADTPATEAPAPTEAPRTASGQPTRATVYTAQNDPVEVEYQVVEAGDVTTSDQAGFDQGAQPRNRDGGNKNSETQIEGIAANPIFARLYRAPEVDRGAPVVGPDGLVESGNGRVMGLRRAYERGTAEDYRAQVIAEFPQAASMTNPVIVARRITDVDRNQFAYTANRSATMAMSATEEGRAEAAMIDGGVLSKYQGGTIDQIRNRDMVRAFIAKLPPAEQNALTTPEGGLSIEGRQRFERALFYRAYGDEKLLRRIAESTDNDMAAVTGALTEAAPRFAQMKNAIEAGQVRSDVDITQNLLEAIQKISDFRRQGLDLAGSRAQIDAFADPTDPLTDAIMGAFFNEAGTRLAGKARVQKFLDRYLEEAMKEQADQADLPGVEPRPERDARRLVDEATGTDDENQGVLLERAPGMGARDAGGRPGRGRPAAGAGRQEAGAGELRDAAGAVAPPKRKATKPQPKGSLAPTFLDFSFTNRNSVFYDAFKRAGISPEAAIRMDTDAQISTLQKVLKDTFGIEVELPTRKVKRKTITGRERIEERTQIKTRDAIDQMLDAYRGMQLLTHIMGVPQTAIGLKDKSGAALKLSLKNALPGALGMYSYNPETNGGRTIHLPGRSNSFAHEWGHALDHWLGMALHEEGITGMLTRDVRKNGIDPTATTNEKAAQAFVGLMQSLFGDRAALAAMQIDLQRQSVEVTKKGNPSPKAKRAQRILADIAAGKKLPESVTSAYFKTSRDYDAAVGAGGYFQDPAEMLARAFETFIGVKASAISDLPMGFLSKPSFAYEGSDEQRARMTFPRGADADAIFDAFERLGEVMREQAIFGSDHKASAPEDVAVYDARHWAKWRNDKGLLEREREAWADDMRRIREAKKLMRAPNSPRVVRDWASQVAIPVATYLRGVVARQPKAAQPALTNLLDRFMLDPGSGRAIKDPWENAVEREFRRRVNAFDAVIQKHRIGNLSQEQTLELRRALTSDDFQPKDANVRAAVPDLRQLMNDAWRYLESSGVKIGYARNGYLPRLLNRDAVFRDEAGFIRQAKKVYAMMFERDVRAHDDDIDLQIREMRTLVARLTRATRPDDTGGVFRVNLFDAAQTDTIETWRAAIRKWRAALRDLDAANESGDGDRIAKAEAKVAEIVENELTPAHEAAMDVVEEVWTTESARHWRMKSMIGDGSDIDTSGPSHNFTEGRTLPSETDAIMAEFYEQDPLTLIQDYLQKAPRRAEYVRRAGENGEQIENLLQRAEEAGADPEYLREIRQTIRMLTGRGADYGTRQGSTVWGWTYVAATLSILDKAVFSSLAEPITAGIRLRDPMASLRAVMATIGQLARTGRAQDRAEIGRISGLITSSAHETLMLNRYGGDFDPSQMQARMLARFFQINLLTPLTNAQRAGMLAVASYAIRKHLKAAVRGSEKSQRELADLGIPAEHVEAMHDWVQGLKGGLPTTDDLLDVGGHFYNEAAALWSQASTRLVNQIIQNPTRYTRPQKALDPRWRLMYGITGFIYSFHFNVLAPLFKYHVSPKKLGENRAKYGARKAAQITQNLTWAAPSIAALFVAQGLAYMLRIAVTDPDKWDELEEASDDDLWKLLYAGIWEDGAKWNTLSRSGLTGYYDIPFNVFTGVKYGTDAASTVAGPHVKWALQPLEASIRLAQQEKATTNTAEYNFARAWARLGTDTASAMLLSSLPGGPMARAGYTGALFAEDVLDPASMFAEALVGEKGKSYPKDRPPPWFEMGPR